MRSYINDSAVLAQTWEFDLEHEQLIVKHKIKTPIQRSTGPATEVAHNISLESMRKKGFGPNRVNPPKVQGLEPTYEYSLCQTNKGDPKQKCNLLIKRSLRIAHGSRVLVDETVVNLERRLKPLYDDDEFSERMWKIDVSKDCLFVRFVLKKAN